MATLKYFTTCFAVAACGDSVYTDWRTNILPRKLASGVSNINNVRGSPSDRYTNGKKVGDVEDAANTCALEDAVTRGDEELVREILFAHHRAGHDSMLRLDDDHLNTALNVAYDIIPGIYIDASPADIEWSADGLDFVSVTCLSIKYC